LIERSVNSSTQTRKTRYDRWLNVAGIFKVIDPNVLSGRHILLVDDVITTGATLEACVAEILKIEGTKVSIAVLAVA
jgi:predicted amidophosphoribosyltransferase